MPKRIAQLASYTVIAIGCLSLLGWQLNLPLLKSGFPGSPSTMKANTAFCFILAGGALGLLQAKRLTRTRYQAVIAMTGLIIVISLLTLGEYSLDRNFGIDELLFQDEQSYNSYPGRMGVNTAINFLLMGLALVGLLDNTRWSNWLSHILSSLAAAISLLAFLGHLYEISVLTVLITYTTIQAPHTAIAFFLLYCGVLLTRPEQGLMKIISSPLIGGLMARRILPWAVILPIALNWSILQGFKLGWYDIRAAYGIQTTLTIITFSMLVWWNSRLLNQIDRERQQTTDALQTSQQQLSLANETLESRILQRTRELAQANEQLQQQLHKRQQIETALRSSEIRFQAIFNSTFQFIGLLKPDGTIIEANQTALDFIGLTRNDVIGKLFWETPWWTHSRDAQQQLKEAISQAALGQFIRYECEHIGQQGQVLKVDFSLKPIKDETGQVILLIPEGRDISEQKQVEIELQEAKEAAIAANMAKSLFLANISHELRTPLNVILGFTQLLDRDHSFPVSQQEHLQRIERSGKHLLGLIEDILELSKIEIGQISINYSDFHLSSLLACHQEMFQVKAQAKGLALLVEASPTLPQYIQSDEKKLHQVLINLLGNAIKFTHQGHVILRVKQVQKEKNFCHLCFEVEDTGVGIAPEELDYLFKIFMQTEAGRNSKQGTGLGLAISQRLVQLLGGEITVKSRVGQGSIFSFTIKVGLVNSSPQSLTCRVISLAFGQSSYRLLVVDDHPDNRQVLVEFLSSVGFEVKEAANGVEAYALWESWSPHLIWMDMRMPVMDGYEVTKRIKEQAQGQKTIIIALTAGVLAQEREKALASGCDDFVSKPFREQAILDKIADYLKVQYIYEALPQLPMNLLVRPLTSADLATMTPEWLEQVYHAAYCLDAEKLTQLIEEIRPFQLPLAQALTNLVNNFDFDQIVALIDELSSTG